MSSENKIRKEKKIHLMVRYEEMLSKTFWHRSENPVTLGGQFNFLLKWQFLAFVLWHDFCKTHFYLEDFASRHKIIKEMKLLVFLSLLASWHSVDMQGRAPQTLVTFVLRSGTKEILHWHHIKCSLWTWWRIIIKLNLSSDLDYQV